MKEMEQQPDKFRYYITSEALNIGTFPQMEGVTVQESVKPVFFESGAVKAFGYIDYPQPLTPEQEQEYALIPSSENPNYLKTAEMGLEQNYNQLDGIINNQEPPRVNQGYTIIDSEIVGHKEFVLAESAREDFHSRVHEEEQDLAEHRPSILSQLKNDAARKDLPAAPQPGHKKDAPER